MSPNIYKHNTGVVEIQYQDHVEIYDLRSSEKLTKEEWRVQDEDYYHQNGFKRVRDAK